MNAMIPVAKYRIGRRSMAALAVALAFCLVSCSHSPSPSASPSTATPDHRPPSAAELLDKAAAAAQDMKKYAFDLQLTQNLSGEGEGGSSSLKLDAQGRAELGPLKIDQTIKSDTDGEVSSLRSILVPDAYYMYDPQFQEWSKLSKSQTGDIVKTLSNLQVNPAQSIQDIRALGSGLQATTSGSRHTIRYEGTGPEAKAFLDQMLESTLYLSGMDPKIRSSIKLDSLDVELTLDSANARPLTYQINSMMTVEYEAGKPSTLEQRISCTYSKHNESAAVVIPEAAKNAPELDPPLD